MKIFIVLSLTFSLSISFGQDIRELIPDYVFKTYEIPEAIETSNGISLIGNSQIAITALKGVYNPNYGFWITSPGSGVMSFSDGGKDSTYFLQYSDDTVNVLLSVDTVISKIHSLRRGMYRLKQIKGSSDLLLYGNSGKKTSIYRFNASKIRKVCDFEGIIYDLSAADKEFLFISRTELYKSNYEGSLDLVEDFEIPLTGVTHCDEQSFLLSTIGGIFQINTSDKKPSEITSLINGELIFQGEYLFVLDMNIRQLVRIKLF